MLNRLIAASADGDTLVLKSVDPATTVVYGYDASDGTLTAKPAHTKDFAPLAVSRDGSRIILVKEFSPPSATGTVYDRSFNELGALPTGTNGGFVFSPDSRYVYAYYPASGQLRKFDLTSSSGGIFTEVGGGVLIATPGGTVDEITISPDGGTIFAASSAGISIFPAP
jgi:WD40 repeat protein